MKTWRIAVIALAVVVAAAATGSLVLAQINDPDPVVDDAAPCSGPPAGTGHGPPWAGRWNRSWVRGRTALADADWPCPFADDEGERAAMHDAIEEAVAETLGLSPEELRAALETGSGLLEVAEEHGVGPDDLRATLTAARTAWLESAVADGRITQEQADHMLEHAPEFAHGMVLGLRGTRRGWNGGGVMGRGEPFRGVAGRRWLTGWEREPGAMHDDILEAIAPVLDLTREQLQAELEAGRTPAEIADEHDVSRDDLLAAINAARTAWIERAVADGSITQEQGDRMLGRVTERASRGLDSGSCDHGARGFGRDHGGRTWGPGTGN